MPSTYTTNLGIEKIATGEQSGTWGDTTNTNFDLIDAAVNGVVSVTLASAGSSVSPNDLPITDGTASDGRNKFIEFVDGGDLGATAYVQLTPNDAEKVVHIRNSLSGGRSIVIFQGTYSAANDFEITNGSDVLLKFDGAGSGAVVSDVNIDLTVTGATIGTVDINGGAIDGTTVGASTPSSGAFTTLSASGDFTVDTDTLFVDASADAVGIGTANPQYLGHFVDGDVAIVDTDTTNNAEKQSLLFGGASGETATLAAITGYRGSNANFGELVFKTSPGTGVPTEVVRIDSSGNVGIGSSTAPSGSDVSLWLARSGANGIQFLFNGTGVDGAKISTPETGGVLAFSTFTGTQGSESYSERMRIDSSGNLLVGTTSGAGLLTLDNAASTSKTLLVSIDSGGTGSHTHAEFRNTNGTVGSIVTASTTTSYNTSSDVRLKQNIADAPAGNIDSLKVRSFDWKVDGSHQEYGFVAQELEPVYPDAVSKGEGPNDMWGVDYSKLVPMLVKEIQDLRARVAQLEAN